ncbi:hypothetical protein [Saccharothrix sp. HUAS TT1]|uniref:hypothetical protein n=1 Tax=unclassified Saccharothrix TaxID=2593673 RepID=UPI00345C45F3
MPEKYGPQEKAALMVLMLEGGAVLNRDLTNQHKIRISPPGRDKLNADGLLRTWSEKRRLVHQITEEGIAWCLKDLSEGEPPARSGPWARAQNEVLKRCVRYLLGQGVRLADVLNPADLESVIRAAYLALSVKPQDWVRLARLRPELNGAERDEVDGVLLEMFKAGEVHLVPESNRKALSEADHAAAIRIGSEDKHLMAIEES